MQPLQGVGVLVTRPEHQSVALCRLFESHGARTWRMPAIDIRAVEVDPLSVGAAQPFDLVLFTSANAVRFGAMLLTGRRDVTLGAIGPATARALQQAGHPVSVLPDAGADTEALLAHAALEPLRNRRVLLVKGRGGRKLLEEELVRRGAEVTCAAVYERVPAEPGAAALERVRALAANGELQVVTATSVEIGTHLLQLGTPALRAALDTLHWLVPASRVAQALKARGLGAPLLIARSAEDQDLVAALLSWRGAASGGA